MSRAIYALLVLFVLALLQGCKPSEQPRIVLYSSIDPGTIKPLLEAYTARTGVRVDLVGDTEATKTTGLVNRLIAEKATPRADVWWSGEAVGTVQLARGGVLAPYTSAAADTAARISNLAAWPIKGDGDMWHGHALRPRVIVYSTRAYTTHDAAPRTLSALGRSAKPVAVANPAFGTTRGHYAALYSVMGREDFVALMSTITWRVYDSNSAVVRAVANGEADAGLTDEDDYRSGLKNGWPLGVTYPAAPEQPNPAAPVCTPSTIALVNGAPNPELAKAFIDSVLSIDTERALAGGEWASIPALPAAKIEGNPLNHLSPAKIDWQRAADALELAAAAWKQALQGAEKK